MALSVVTVFQDADTGELRENLVFCLCLCISLLMGKITVKSGCQAR